MRDVRVDWNTSNTFQARTYLLQLARNRSVSRRALFAKFPSCMSNPFMLVHRFKVCFWAMVGLGHPPLLLHISLYPLGIGENFNL